MPLPNLLAVLIISLKVFRGCPNYLGARTHLAFDTGRSLFVSEGKRKGFLAPLFGSVWIMFQLQLQSAMFCFSIIICMC